jgi:hypothetical protein
MVIFIIPVFQQAFAAGAVFDEDETVVGSAFIQWNEGQIEWLEASYPASGTGVVRVTDPDMNLDPKAVDNFDVHVWSDSDAGGIDLTVTETNASTGIFEGTVFFTITDESSGHRLRVHGEDTITAEYEDNTLPEPFKPGDGFDITGTAIIQKIPPLSPNKQLMIGVLNYDVICKDNLEKIFRPSGSVACVESSSIVKLTLWGWNTNEISVNFVGEWKNKDSATNDIANIVITQTGSTVTANAWDRCDPRTFCDWGESFGGIKGNSAKFSWTVESITHKITITKIRNTLQVDRESISFDTRWTQNKQMSFILGTLTLSS